MIKMALLHNGKKIMLNDRMTNHTHIWMFFYRYINFFRMNDWRSAALGKNEGLLHVAVDLEEVSPHFPDF